MAYIWHLIAPMDDARSPDRRVFLLTWLAPLAATLVMAPAAEVLAQTAPSTSRPRASQRKRRQVGLATFYSRQFAGDETASGTRYDPNSMTAAHRTWPFGTVVRVTELENGRSVDVTIVDRGPFGKNRRKGAIIDLSSAAARKLNMLDDGVVRVRLDVVRWGKEATAEAQRR